MSVTAYELREAMRTWATGVALVTASHAGVQHGMTVSSFTSVSLEPALILVSLERIARTRELVLQSGKFAISILSNRQQAVSDRFAGRHTEDEDRFAGLAVEPMPSGILVVAEALAYLDCRVEHCYEASTHTLVIGEVQGTRIGETALADGKPLLYFNRAYRFLFES